MATTIVQFLFSHRTILLPSLGPLHTQYISLLTVLLVQLLLLHGTSLESDSFIKLYHDYCYISESHSIDYLVIDICVANHWDRSTIV